MRQIKAGLGDSYGRAPPTNTEKARPVGKGGLGDSCLGGPDLPSLGDQRASLRPHDMAFARLLGPFLQMITWLQQVHGRVDRMFQGRTPILAKESGVDAVLFAEDAF